MILFQPKAVVFTKPIDFEKPIIFKSPGSRSKLVSGDELRLGESLYSPSGEYRFAFQSTDGNIVLYNRAMQAFWSPNVAGHGAIRIDMQTDGNLVAYDAQMRPIWATGTDGHPGAFFQLQDDGNAVVYAENLVPLWSSDTVGGHWHGDNDGWLSKIVTAAGRPFEAATHLLAEGVTGLANLAGQIPLIGPALHGVLLIASGPFTFTDAVLDGERIDRALIADLRDKITAVREVAPYAQTVLSLVPGIGQGAAAAIGAGLALAQGMPIGEALKAGIRGALPGGPLAASAFDLTVAAASGDNIITSAGNVALANLGLPPAATEGLSKALTVVYKASQGDNIPLAALDEARSYIPTDQGKQAFDVALAVAHGKRLQTALVDGIKDLSPAGLATLRDAGADILAQTPVLTTGQKLLQGAQEGTQRGLAAARWAEAPVRTARDGYGLAVGLMKHAGVNEDVVKAIRGKLGPNERQGFDMGLAAYHALVLSPVPTSLMGNPAAQAGYLVTQGLAGNAQAVKTPVAQQFFLVPQVAHGRTYAIAQQRASEGFFGWLKRMVFG